MNLYTINFEHYSQKDSEQGIYTYLVAQDDDVVYEWIKSEPEVNQSTLYNSYKYNEDEKTYDIYDDDYNVVGVENFKDRMIRLQGEMYDEEVELNDLYYGKTLIGWELIKENILEEDISVLMDNIHLVVLD